MSRTILDPQYANSLNGLFDGTTPIDVSSIVATSVSLTGNESTVSPSLSTNSGNNMVVSTPSGSGITLSSGAGATTISSTGGGAITVGGSITTSGVYVNGSESTVSPSISTNIGNNMVVSTPTGSGITLSSGAGATTISSTGGGAITVGGSVSSTEYIITNGTDSVNLQCTAADTLTINPGAAGVLVVGGNISGTTFSGGIGSVLVTGASPGNIAIGGSYLFTNVTIPNFIGTSYTSYVVTGNYAGTPSLPFVYSALFNGYDGTGGTYVDVQVMNVSSTNSYDVSINFSIIAMNQNT
jgi:hypothetical protein